MSADLHREQSETRGRALTKEKRRARGWESAYRQLWRRVREIERGLKVTLDDVLPPWEVKAKIEADGSDAPQRVQVNRILWNNKAENDIDEIVLHNALVHVEQMDDRCWWIGVYLDDDRCWAGNFIADSRGRMRFAEQENDCIEWDREGDHART